jgi:predicted MFS family arabinose efflux permease
VASNTVYSKRFQSLALLLLLLIYTFNYLDRTILGVLLESIRRDLGLSDTQLGALTGIAFALFYCIAGLPIARYADRHSRPVVIAICLSLWSLATGGAGLAQSFTQLLLLRVAVGVGEAGGAPASISLLASYFPPSRLGRALGIYALGASLGAGLGLAVGGQLDGMLGWRLALVIVGLPGLPLAYLSWRLLTEPRELGLEICHTEDGNASAAGAIRHLVRRPTFVLLLVAGAGMCFCEYGLLQWMPTFLSRSFGLSSAATGWRLGIVVGVAQASGVVAGGFLSDWLSHRDPRWALWVSGGAALAAIPFSYLMLTASSPSSAILLLAAPQFLGVMYYAPTLGLVQQIAPAEMRTTAAAVALLVFNLIGLGLGPQAIGIASDLLRPQFGSESLRVALTMILGSFAVAAVAFLAAARWIAADIPTKPPP